jgi:hypothetical protein
MLPHERRQYASQSPLWESQIQCRVLSPVFCDIVPYSQLKDKWHFKSICHPHPQGWRARQVTKQHAKLWDIPFTLGLAALHFLFLFVTSVTKLENRNKLSTHRFLNVLWSFLSTVLQFHVIPSCAVACALSFLKHMSKCGQACYIIIKFYSKTCLSWAYNF